MGLTKFLVETILGEAAEMDKVVVVYSGRFQPFHKGHYATYDHLVKKFGKDSVYIGTSDVTDNKKSPFGFKEKKAIMMKMFGISSNKIVQIKNPYAPQEILNKYDSDTTGFITVVGEKDSSRLSGKYFTPYKGKVEEPYLDKGYVYAAPAQPNAISGTDVRYWLSAGNEEERKKNFTKAYPKFDSQIFKLITLKLKGLKECINEEIKLNVKIGDTLLMGKFKNKKVIVKTIGTDEWGMPTINGKKAVTFRIPKKENLKETASNSGFAGQDEPDTSFVADGQPRILNTAKPEGWYKQGGYTQIDTPKADAMRGRGKTKDTETQFRKAYYKLKNVTQSTLNPANDPHKVEDWDDAYRENPEQKPKRFWELPKNQKPQIISKEDINEIMNEIEAEMIGEMGLGGGAGIGLSLPGGYINGAPDPKDVKKLKSKLDGDGSEEYQPIDEKVVDDIIICDNCNWQWEMKEGGDAMYLCHKCGHDNHPKLAEGLNDLEKELVSLYNKAFKMMPKSPAQMKVRAEIDKVKKQIDSLKKESITEAEMNPVKKVVNAILKKHGVNAMKTTSTSVRGFHNIVNNGYSYDGNNFLRFYKVSPDVVEKVADEIQKAGVRVYSVNKSGTIKGDFSKTGLVKEATSSEILKDLDKVKSDLLKKADVLITKKKKLYSNVDIETPMSADEKKLDKEIAELFSEIQQLIQQKRSLKKESINELTQKEQRIKDGKPGNTYYVYYKGQFAVDYDMFGMSGVDRFYREKFKVRKVKGSSFNPDFIIITKIDYDRSPNHYSKLKPYIDKFWDKLQSESVTESLIMEGGAYGHMNHPFDIEMNLTFGDLKSIVTKALNGDLELTREKTDGQALAVSWVNGRLVAARNKSHLKNKGAGAMTIGQVAEKFGGRGGLTDAYNFAMQDLSKAIAALSEPQRLKIFKDGACFMNLEVIYPTSVNVIPYNQPLLVFHGTFEYDDAGTIIGENQQAASILGGMIKQVNAHVQSKYTIQGPPMTKLPKSEDLAKLQGKYLGMISKLQSEFGLSDNDGVGEYHQAWWSKFVEKGGKKLDAQEKIGLVKRWAFGDKAFRIATIQDVKLRAWAEQIDKQDQQKISKQNLMRFEEIFLGVGADVLSFMESVLTANPDSAKRQMVARLQSTISQVKASGDPKKVEKLKLELQRLNALGGFDKIVPNEGIVFVYDGNTYKLTGAFAPLNQILGIFFDN